MKARNAFPFTTISLVLMTIVISLLFAGPGRTGAQILNLGGGTRAAALGDDFGLQYELPKIPTSIRIGAAVQNWGTRIALKDENQVETSVLMPIYNQSHIVI